MVKSFASTVVLLNATSTIFSGWIRVGTGSALITTGGAIQKNVREQNGAPLVPPDANINVVPLMTTS